MLGIGNELRGDDAAGLLVARALQARAAGSASWLVVEAGAAPENFTGALRRFSPDLVLLVDAVQMDAPPGEIACLDWQETEGLSASTHTLPLHMISTYLAEELGCQVLLLGIQPKQNDFDASLSAEVRSALEQIVEEFELLIS